MRELLEKLFRRGRKTANVVLNVAFGRPTIAVDTHIFRVSNRTGLAPSKNPLQVEQKLEKLVPETFLHGAHHWLILHGRYTYGADAGCWHCPVVELCSYQPKTPAPRLDPAPLQPLAESRQQLILRQATGLRGRRQVVIKSHPIALREVRRCTGIERN